MNFIVFLLLCLLAVALSAGVVWCEYYLAKQKVIYWSLIPSAVVLFASLLTLLIMRLCDVDWFPSLVTFYLLQIPVVLGVLILPTLRLHRRIRVAAASEKQNRLMTARRIEAEKRRQLAESLKGFRCAESKMKLEGQREVVTMSKNGKTPEEISALSGVAVDEIKVILESYERYAARIEEVGGTADLILTPEQEEDIVGRLVNSLPYECEAGTAGLWDKFSARQLAADRLQSGVSTRIISAYLKHWGFTVPAQQTIKVRSEEPAVRNWIASDFEKIRKAAFDAKGEIVWIYTVPMVAIREITTYVPSEPVMLAAVTGDGSIRFKVYDQSDRDRFADFVTSLISGESKKLFAVVNENYDDYMSRLGKGKRKAMEEHIEFFPCS